MREKQGFSDYTNPLWDIVAGVIFVGTIALISLGDYKANQVKNMNQIPPSVLEQKCIRCHADYNLNTAQGGKMYPSVKE